MTLARTLMISMAMCLPASTALAFSDPGPDTITITASNIGAVRSNLIGQIWGQATLPGTQATLAGNVASPITQVTLTNLARVDKLSIATIECDDVTSFPNTAYVFFPAANANNRVALMHMGHGVWGNQGKADGIDDSPTDNTAHGYARTVQALLSSGFVVAALMMPGMQPEANWGGTLGASTQLHEGLFSAYPYACAKSSLRYFLDPSLQVVNYLTATYPAYTEYDMTGLSGGGWTTTLYSALDTRIAISAPTAGSLPFSIHVGRDAEQRLQNALVNGNPTSLTGIGGYQDLYLLASSGTTSGSRESTRRQVQVLNRADNCCFGEPGFNQGLNQPPYNAMSWNASVRDYEKNVRTRLLEIGGNGAFQVEMSEPCNLHSFCQDSIDLIVGELEGGRRFAGAAVGGSDGQSLLARGAGGTLWLHDGSGWSDTGLTSVGAPSVTAGVCDAYDVAYRNNDNHLMWGHQWEFGWQTIDLSGAPIVGDPTVTSGGASRFDIVALRPDPNNRPAVNVVHWSSTNCGTTWASETLGGGVAPLGVPTIVSSGSPRLDVFYKGKANHDLNHFSTNGGAWTFENIAGNVMRGDPAAIPWSASHTGVYMISPAYHMLQAWSSSGAWLWYDLSTQSGSQGTALSGSPTASVDGSGNIRIWVSTRDAANLAAFFWPNGGAWSFGNKGGTIVGSPTVQGAVGAFARDVSGGMWFNNGGAWSSLGGYVND